MFRCSPLWVLCGIADPLWSCVMLLCGPLWVLCGPLQSFAVFSHTGGVLLIRIQRTSTDTLVSASIYTHTRLMTLCPRLPRWAGTRKVKLIWILLKQETVSVIGISWAICTLLQTDNHASTPSLSFLQAGCPSCRPTNSIRALKECPPLFNTN